MFYNEKRWHQNFDRKTPAMVYFNTLPQNPDHLWPALYPPARNDQGTAETPDRSPLRSVPFPPVSSNSHSIQNTPTQIASSGSPIASLSVSSVTSNSDQSKPDRLCATIPNSLHASLKIVLTTGTTLIHHHTYLPYQAQPTSKTLLSKRHLHPKTIILRTEIRLTFFP
jgi:hypothetical protein